MKRFLRWWFGCQVYIGRWVRLPERVIQVVRIHDYYRVPKDGHLTRVYYEGKTWHCDVEVKAGELLYIRIGYSHVQIILTRDGVHERGAWIDSP